MTAWMAWAISLPGFAALSLAMERHQQQVLGRALGPRATLALRAVGLVLLALALAVCGLQWRWPVATVAWLGVLSFAAVAVGLMLSYRPRGLPPLALGCAAIGATAWLLRAVTG